MKNPIVAVVSTLLLLVLVAFPALAQVDARECTLECWTTVPTVTVADISTYFLGFHNWYYCPGSATYIWDFGDGSPTMPYQFGVHRYGASGTYTWTVTVNLEGDTCTRTGTIVVDPPADGCGFGATGLPTGLSILGSATRRDGGGVDLTPDQADQTGAIWCLNMTPVYAGFETIFHFRIDHSAPRDVAGAEGFAFVLMYHGLQYSSAVGQGGSSMGYEWLYGIAVEFDTSLSPERGDPDGNHVSVMRNRVSAGLTAHHTDSLATASPPFEIADGAVHSARILYESGTLSVFLDGATDPLIHVPVNIADITTFPQGECYAGFTAATSTEFAGHRILDWTMNPAGPECVLTCNAVAPSVANPGGSAYFAGSAGTTDCEGTPTFDWDFGDGTAHSSERNPVHLFAAEGTYTWTMTVTVDDKTCTRTGTVTVREPCVLSCTATVPGQTAKDQPVAFLAEASASNCGGALSFVWTFGDGAASAEQNPSHAYAVPGTYTWTLAVTAEGETCNQTGTITVTGGIPGDCNGDGTVSIGEVQKAINMFLGIEPVGCGADCNGDGTISIGEVQKVINAFLGVANSC